MTLLTQNTALARVRSPETRFSFPLQSSDEPRRQWLGLTRQSDKARATHNESVLSERCEAFEASTAIQAHGNVAQLETSSLEFEPNEPTSPVESR